MLELRTLGTIELRDSATGREFRALLSQAKRAALLFYIARAGAGGYHRRDELMTLFWAELPEKRARAALRQALYVLRRELPSDALDTRRGDDVRLDPAAFHCDAVVFDDLLRAGNLERALELYRGDLLPGFHVAGCTDFEDWLETERTRLRRAASRAAWTLFEARDAAGDVVDAVHWARRATEWAPYDEAGVRRLLELLERCGDRAGAVRAYQAFRHRLERELEIAPAPETAALGERLTAEAVAQRSGAAASALEGHVTETGGGAQGCAVEGSDAVPLPATPDLRAPRPAPPTEAPPSRPDTGNHMRGGGWKWAATGAVISILATAALLSSRPNVEVNVPTAMADRILGEGGGAASGTPRALVLPLRNETGDSALARVGLMAADWVAQGLTSTQLVEVVTSSARGVRIDAHALLEPEGLREIARESGATLVVGGAYYGTGDTIRLQARIVDPADGRILAAFGPIPAPTAAPMPSIHELRRVISGGLAPLVDRRMSRWAERASRPPSFEAYNEFIEGLAIFTEQGGAMPGCVERSTVSYERTAAAVERFSRAAAVDSTFTQPLLWSIMAHSHVSAFDNAEHLLQRLKPRRAQLAPLDRAMLDAEEALLRGDYHQGLEAMGRVLEIAPEAEYRIRAAEFALWLNDPAEAVRILEPMGSAGDRRLWWRTLTQAHHALGRHREELRVARLARAQLPGCSNALDAEAVALAAVGDVAALEATIAEILAHDSELFGTRLVRYALELRAHGHTRAAESLLQRAIAWYDAMPQDLAAREPREVWAHAEAYLAAGLYTESKRLFDLIADRAPLRLISLGERGYLAATLGDLDEARRISTKLAQHPESYPLGIFRSASYWRAVLAAGLGEHDRAVRLLREALEKGWRAPHRLHSDPHFAVLRSYPPFEELIRPRGTGAH
ncbi:MAG TPA: BTAD domain-containing putative transcriptional regulator [Longimicrobiales bacterium]|nr:BTAD domain-containing putative transcriptional regulator [Longimicrobiales bacterium]